LKYTVTLLFIALLYSQLSVAQTQNYPNSLSYNLLGVDTYSPYLDELYRFDQQTFAFSATYSRYLKNSLSLSFAFRVGSMNYPYDISYFHKDWNFYAQDVVLRYGFSVNENKSIQPYLTAGVGVRNVPKYTAQPWAAELPLGLGLNIKIIDQIWLQLSTEYRFSQSASAWHNGIGLQFRFQNEKKTISSTAVPFKTSEKTTLTRSIKPTITDLVSSNFNDLYDFNAVMDDHRSSKLETIDTDRDGVPDAIDRCPNVFGSEDFGGCPIVDTDGDGLADFEDKCPSEYGDLEMAGCPLSDEFNPKTSLPSLFFDTRATALKPENMEHLERLAETMKRYPDAVLNIAAYAFDGYSAEENIEISVRRGKNCFDFLIKQGISADRMTYVGFGNKRLVENQKLRKGVEFQLFFEKR
jgi:hypothetical protein